MTGKKTAVKVMIGGEEYSLRSDRSDEYTRAVAQHVDRALADVRSMGTIVETHKAAILAALAITDELFQCKAADRELENRIRDLSAEVSRFLPPQKRRNTVL